MTHPRTDAATFFITNAKNAPPECILTTIERNSSAKLADRAIMMNEFGPGAPEFALELTNAAPRQNIPGNANIAMTT